MTFGNWKDKNVLITGINGFIGSAVAYKLTTLGANVIGLVKEVNKSTRFGGCTVLQGDICDPDVVRHAISYYEIDVIFHFAAYAIVRVAAKDPLSTYKVNIMGTVNLLEAARTIGKCTSIIVASSDKAYGDHDVLPYTENFALQPKNTYDTSKACMDMIARTYAYNYDMPIVVTRCSNVYGPGDSNLSRIVPNSVLRVLRGERAQVYSDVSDMTREFIYIEDVVDAYLGLAPVTTDRKGEAYNIGGGGQTKIYDLVNKITKLAGGTEEPEVLTRDSVFKEIQHQYIDATKLYATTGWKPEVTLEEGLKKTIEWYGFLI